MKLGLFVSPLGGIAPPFGHSEKCALTLGGALLASGIAASASATASGISNYLNNRNIAATNETNMEIAKMNNDTSQKQYEETMNWLKYQFQKQREYSVEDRTHNDIGQVAQRALAAGINPAALVGSGQSSGQTVSSVGAPSPSVFQAPHIEPSRFDFTGLSEGVGRAVDAFYENRLRQKQAEGLEFDNQIKEAQAATSFWKEIQTVRNIMADTDEKLSHLPKNSAEYQEILARKESIERDLWERIDNYNERRKQLENSNKLMERQEKHIGFEENMAVSQLQIQRALAASNISLNGAQMGLIGNQINLVLQQAQTEFERGRNISADTLSKRIETQLKSAVRDEKLFEADKVNGSKFLKNLRGFSHYVGDLMFSQLKDLF